MEKKEFLFLYIFSICMFVIFAIGIFSMEERELKEKTLEYSNTITENQNTQELYREDILYMVSEYKEMRLYATSLVNQNEELREQIVDLQIENDEYKEMLEDSLQNEVARSENDLELLYKIAAAEAGYKSKDAQKNVIYVILNRVNDNNFPNTIKEVIYQKDQFSGARNDAVIITDNVRAAVNEAFEDYCYGESANGALYFGRCKTGGTEYLFTDAVGHKFYR